MSVFPPVPIHFDPTASVPTVPGIHKLPAAAPTNRQV